jgi:hypothetical protein
MPNERENPLIFNYFRVSMIKFSICIVDIVNKEPRYWWKRRPNNTVRISFFGRIH